MIARLHPDDIDAIARRVVELQHQGTVAPAGGLLSVKALATHLGVSTAFVYEHAIELGGVKLSNSPKAPWRFDVAQAQEAMRQRVAADRPTPTQRVDSRRAPRAAATTPSGVPLLPIKGKAA